MAFIQRKPGRANCDEMKMLIPQMSLWTLALSTQSSSTLEADLEKHGKALEPELESIKFQVEP
jgi:hypothetical protein